MRGIGAVPLAAAGWATASRWGFSDRYGTWWAQLVPDHPASAATESLVILAARGRPIDSPSELSEHIAGHLGLTVDQAHQAMLTHAPPQLVRQLEAARGGRAIRDPW